VAHDLPGPGEMTNDDIGQVLGTLITANPGFRIRYQQVGWLGLLRSFAGGDRRGKTGVPDQPVRRRPG
jgi:hypothetical protein